jgi:hypothetical protein
MTTRNPTRHDRKEGSFVIWTTGTNRGGFRDYATDQSGDIIDLGAFAHNREKDRKFAFDLARDFLGLKSLDPKQRAALRQRAREQERIVAAQSQAKAVQKRIRASKMFHGAQPLGDIAHSYFASREIPLLQMITGHTDARVEADLRFQPKLEWWRGAEWRDGERVRPGPTYPAIVAAIRDRHGDLTAVHCTFLRADGSGKADVENPKLMFGDVRGSVIRIAKGKSDATPEEAAVNGARGPLVITEGIEDALSVSLALPEVRVWAATSLGNLGNVYVDHPCVSTVTVAADNDWSTPKAMDALDNAVAQLAIVNRNVTVMRAHDGKDFNDLLKAG